MTESVGGHLDAMYFGFGDQDVYVLCELPYSEAAAAVSLTVGAAGGATAKTVVLMTPEEFDRATPETVDYHARVNKPGPISARRHDPFSLRSSLRLPARRRS